VDLDTLLRDYELDLNELIGKDKKSLIHLLIRKEDIKNLELILSLPKEDYKTKTRPDLNIVDEQWGWTPLITAMNQGPKGFLPAINALLRAGADPFKEIPSDRDKCKLYTAA
jgi:ankyrin repeat protein